MGPTSIRRNYPLSSHPEFSVIQYPGYQEYRLENRDLNLNHGVLNFVTLWPVLIVSLLAICLQTMAEIYSYPAMIILLLFFVRSTLLPVLYESVVLLPPHGIQLETCRGFPGGQPLICSRHFIPTAALGGVFINEGLKGWNVLYCLAVVKRQGSGSGLKVAYQNLLPCHSVLLQTFEGIHKIILSSPIAALQSPQKASTINYLP